MSASSHQQPAYMGPVGGVVYREGRQACVGEGDEAIICEFCISTQHSARVREGNPEVDAVTAVVRHPLGRRLPRQDGVARGRGHHRDAQRGPSCVE